MVRRAGATIEGDINKKITYVIGDLRELHSIKQAVAGIDTVISTANGILPQKRGDKASNINDAALQLIKCCEDEAAVSRFVQSSVPPYKNEEVVTELLGKRRIEERLRRSSMQSIVIRNAAFMHVSITMGGFKQAQDRSAQATTRLQYDFAQRSMATTGNLAEKYGLLLAPGGADHGNPSLRRGTLPRC